MNYCFRALLIKIITFLLLESGYLLAQELRFDHFSVEDGLSQSSAFCVLQDKTGYIWVGTQDGLNKFDGYNFTVFQKQAFTANTITDNYITCMIEDKAGNLWLGTANGGVNKLDRTRTKFSALRNDKNNPNSLCNNGIWSLLEDSKNNLWIGTQDGLDVYNTSTSAFSHVLSNFYVFSIQEDKSGNFWVGTSNGLFQLSGDYKILCHFTTASKPGERLSDNRVWSILQDSKRRLWIGTQNGLNLFSPADGSVHQFLKSKSGNGFVPAIHEDKSGQVWFGTIGGGLYRYDSDRGCIQAHYFKEQRANSIWSICTDRTGNLWLGTNGGVYASFSEKQKWSGLTKIIGEKNSLSDNYILSVFEDNEGELWIGTRDGGLNRVSKNRKNYIHYRSRPDDKNWLNNDKARAICQDNNGLIWLGTEQGLYGFDKKSGKFKGIYSGGNSGKSLSNNSVTALCPQGGDILWIGVYGSLEKLNLTTGIIKHYFAGKDSGLNNGVIKTLYADKEGILWIGTQGGGLSRFDPVKEQFTHFINRLADSSSISDNYVRTIYDDNNRALWIGTSCGLNRFDKISRRFFCYTRKNGLPGDVIYGLTGDRYGNIWISTNRGISMYDRQKSVFSNYDMTDGLLGNEFNSNAAAAGSDGRLYFGGVNGLNILSPDGARDNKFIPPVVLTAFKVFNHNVQFDLPINEVTEIELAYDQNFFSFEFAALDYTNPGKNQYAYFMDGFDRNWYQCGMQRYAQYMNLPPGTYTFWVKACNNSGKWNEAGKSVTVKIIPPIWRRWWFILASIAAALTIIILGVRYRIRSLLAIENLRTKIAADLHDNIGAGLTEISLLNDIQIFKLSQQEQIRGESLEKINEIARSLVDNMSDIVWLINPRRDSLYDLILRIKDNYEELLTQSRINLTIDNLHILKNIRLPLEYKKQIYLILNEGMNNIFKHSACGSITIKTMIDNKMLIIDLEDNGRGFEQASIAAGNGLGNMKQRAGSIGGELVINSEPGKGTALHFKCKIKRPVYFYNLDKL